PLRQPRHYILHERDIREVAEDEARARIRAVERLWNGELTRQKTTRPGCVDDERCVDLDGGTVARAAQGHAGWTHLARGQLGSIAIVHTGGNGLTHEVVVDVGAEPMRVRHVCVRARGDQQSLGLESAVRERGAGVMAIERESALQSSA